MTIYTQPKADVFASAAPESEIQDFQAWTRGLGIAFDETNGYPEMTGLNGLFNAFNLYIKYLEQNGFSEWRSDLEYPAGAGVRVGLVWYRATVQNENKPPATSQNEWELFLNANALSYTSPLVINGNTISILDATTAQKGVTQFANATEVANKSNVSKAITPINVSQMFTASKNSNGYVQLPNGLTLQWFLTAENTVGNANTNFVTVTFPKAFTNACYHVNTSLVNSQGGCSTGYANVTTTGCQISLANLSGSTKTLRATVFVIGE